MKTGIYKIISPTNRVYIGQSIDIEKRLKQYKRGDFKQQKRLYLSYLKYGWDFHIFEILEECSEHKLNCKERYWQDKFDVLSAKGMNCILQECGEKRKIYSQDIRDKIGNSNKGKTKGFIPWNKGLKLSPQSEDTKKKISLSNTGKIFSQETKDKISKANNGKKHSEETKILMSKLRTGKKLSEELKNKLSLIHKGKSKSSSHRENISKAKKGISKLPETIEKFCKKLLQFSKNNEFIKEWKSGKEVEEELKINKTHISSCCNKKRKTAGGYIWKFK